MTPRHSVLALSFWCLLAGTLLLAPGWAQGTTRLRPLFVSIASILPAPQGLDTDGDGLDDSVEAAIGTDPLDVDSDDDALSDGEEYNIHNDTWVRSPVNHHYYCLTQEALTWEEAKGAARDLAGEMVTIRSQPEQNWLHSSLTDQRAWIGFSDAAVEGTWRWESGEPVVFTYWAPGEPNNFGVGQDFAVLNHHLSAYGDQWDDDGGPEGSNAIYPAILERLFPPSAVSLNPLNPDTDNDGLWDGQELGRSQGLAGSPASSVMGTDLLLLASHIDLDPSTTTDPRDQDTDRGGLPDGLEDANLNGRLDGNETNPTLRHGADDTPALHPDLVAQYLFDGDSRDSSGNLNHGIVRGATLTVDRNGNANAAFAFDGSSYIEVPNSRRLNVSSSFTLSVWVKNSQPTVPSMIISKLDSITDSGFLLSNWSNHYLLQFGDGCGGWPYSGNVSSSTTVFGQEWKHLAATRSGSLVSFYIDGVLDAVVQTGPENLSASNNRNLWIGADVNTGSLSFNTFIGAIDDVRIFDRALSSADVASLAAGILPPITPVTPVCNLPFNGNAHDESGNGNDGQVFGATLAPDRFGNPNSAYAFNGNAYIAIYDSPSLRLSSEYAISLWLLNTRPTSPSIILGKHDAANDSGYLLSHYLNHYATQFGDGCGGWPYSGTVYSDSTVIGNQWTHLLVSRSGSSVSYFVNGILDSSNPVGPANIASSYSDIWIGADVNTGVLTFNTFFGVLDDIMIFDRAITPAEFFQSKAPVAVAGADQSVHAGQLVTVDGTASFDPDEEYPLDYQWTLVEMPSGSLAQLYDSTSPTPSIRPDALGDYVLGLTVLDMGGLVSVSDEITLSTFNAPPVADAGLDQTVTFQGSSIQLSGIESWDPEGDYLSFSWEVTLSPMGSQASLSDRFSSSPTFVVDEYGAYSFRLTVSDPWDSSTPDEVWVSFENLSPVADAGQTQSGVVGESFFLDGGGSFDPNNDPLSFSWSIVSAPMGSTAALSSESSARTNFTADLPGSYTVGLVVNDGFLSSTGSNTTITVVSLEDTLIHLLADLIDSINTTPGSNFKNRSQRDVYARKVGTVMSLVETGDFGQAEDKLLNDVLRKADGCQNSGQPDMNDWIRDCASQDALTPLITAALQILDSLT